MRLNSSTPSRAIGTSAGNARRTVFGSLAVAVTTMALLAAGHQAPTGLDGVLRDGLGQAPAAPNLDAAALVLQGQASRLGVDAADFAFTDVAHSHIGTHMRGTEVRNGVPVDGTSAAVHIALDGRIISVEARPSGLAGHPVALPVAREVAIASALTAIDSASPYDVDVRRVMVPVDGQLVDVWRVAVVDVHVPVAATVDVSAADSTVVQVIDSRRNIEGAALVFDPNPIVALQDASLRQLIDVAGVDADTEEYSHARVALDLLEVELAGLPAGVLQGPWVNAVGATAIPPPVNGNWLVDLNRSAPQFETLMTYTHLDRLQRYLQFELGFVGESGVNAESQEVITFPVPGFDNSFYQPGNDLMLMGGGGVDDGEDAEVILHEYGHAIHDAQVPGWGSTAEGGAMGEGFGDFLAGAFFASHSSLGFQDTCLMEWDSTSYSSETPTCIRRMDRAKHYPESLENAVHADGELWSQFMWNIRERIVPDAEAATFEDMAQLAHAKTDRVLTALLNSHFLLTPTAEFADAVAALQTVAQETSDAHLLQVVESEAKRIGFDFDPRN